MKTSSQPNAIDTIGNPVNPRAENNDIHSCFGAAVAKNVLKRPVWLARVAKPGLFDLSHADLCSLSCQPPPLPNCISVPPPLVARYSRHSLLFIIYTSLRRFFIYLSNISTNSTNSGLLQWQQCNNSKLTGTHRHINDQSEKGSHV